MDRRKWQLLLRRRIGQAVDDKRKLEQGRAAHAGPTVGARPSPGRFGLVNDSGDEGGQAVDGFRWCFHCFVDGGWWITGYVCFVFYRPISGPIYYWRSAGEIFHRAARFFHFV